MSCVPPIQGSGEFLLASQAASRSFSSWECMLARLPCLPSAPISCQHAVLASCHDDCKYFLVDTVNIFLGLLYREVLVHVALLPADVLPALGAVPGRGRRGQRRGVPLAHELVLPVAGHWPPKPVTYTIIVVGIENQ